MNLNANQIACKELIDQIKFDENSNLLDIGMGSGWLSIYLAKKKLEVTGTTFSKVHDNLDIEYFKKEYNITIHECNIESLPFAENTYDYVILSHVLEHCNNTGLALNNILRVLKTSGKLIIIVPRHQSSICAGHVHMGWNVGQLIYTLLINGYDVSTGSFIDYKGNVCAIVQKSTFQLPKLNNDWSDIAILGEAGLFPLPILTQDNRNDGFWGNIESVNCNFVSKLNWDNNKIRALTKFFPQKIIFSLGAIMYNYGDLLMRITNRNPIKLFL